MLDRSDAERYGLRVMPIGRRIGCFVLLCCGSVLAQDRSEIPDLTQTEIASDGGDGGAMYCAPVSVANSILWLAANGYPELVDDPEDEEAQRKLVLKLAKLMGTNIEIGTNPPQICWGLTKFLEQKGVEGFSLHFAGWRPAPQGSIVIEQPTLEWLKKRSKRLGSVWLNFGYYEQNGEEFKRSGGHWVTLVAVDAEEGILTVSDPAPSAGHAGQHTEIQLEELESGQLTGFIKGLPQPAAGYFKAVSGFRWRKKINVAILDCALAIKLEEK